jgi:hypothetical protein
MFEKKSTEYWTSLVLAGLVRSIMHQTSPVWTGQVRSWIVLRPNITNFLTWTITRYGKD